jgi:hypothetical protein
MPRGPCDELVFRARIAQGRYRQRRHEQMTVGLPVDRLALLDLASSAESERSGASISRTPRGRRGVLRTPRPGESGSLLRSGTPYEGSAHSGSAVFSGSRCGMIPLQDWLVAGQFADLIRQVSMPRSTMPAWPSRSNRRVALPLRVRPAHFPGRRPARRRGSHPSGAAPAQPGCRTLRSGRPAPE